MRFVVHCKREPYDVYIGRPGPYGNCYSHIPGKGEVLVQSREEAIRRFEEDLRAVLAGDPAALADFLTPLAGKTLGCWCAPNPCHGDVYVRLCRELGLAP